LPNVAPISLEDRGVWRCAQRQELAGRELTPLIIRQIHPMTCHWAKEEHDPTSAMHADLNVPLMAF
jgi:hypothetical protein